MLILSLTMSVFVAAVVIAVGKKGQYLQAAGVAGCFLFVACTMFSPIHALQIVLIVITALICSAGSSSDRAFVCGVLAATLAPYGLVSLAVIHDMQHEKRDPPLISMSERLAYETASRPSWPGESWSEEHLGLVEKRLQAIPHNDRFRQLEGIHESFVSRFVNHEGFGFGKFLGAEANITFSEVGSAIRSPMKSDPDSSIRLPQEGRPPDTFPPGYSPGKPLPPPAPRLLTFHEDSLVDFAHPNRFGYVRDRDRVAGFEPHEFSRMPKSGQKWRLQRLELVSLLKHDSPVVYLTPNLPRMKELRHAPTRPLESWEQVLLAQLIRGEELRVLAYPDHLRMLGAVRAARQCVVCHSVKRGKLLGAFSYVLQLADRDED